MDSAKLRALVRCVSLHSPSRCNAQHAHSCSLGHAQRTGGALNQGTGQWREGEMPEREGKRAEWSTRRALALSDLMRIALLAWHTAR